MFNVVGISGSLREGSYSRAVMHSIRFLLPEESNFSELLPGDLPHYNQDLDGHSVPESVIYARELVAKSDALLVVTPEFNHGLPGILKNTLDWLSRPAFSSCSVGKPVMFVTISPGALGGVRAQYQLRETLSSMLCRLVPLPEIAISYVGAKLEEDRLTDRATVEHIRLVLQSFLRQVKSDPPLVP